MSQSDRRNHRLIASALLGLGLLACSPAVEKAPPTPEREQETPATDGADGRRIGVSGGRLVIAVTSDPRTFHPALAVSGATRTVLDLMHEDLMTFDPVSQRVVPSLAESWTPLPGPASETAADPGPLVYRMTLRPDVRFSDGEPVDVDDVLFTVRTILDPEVGSPQRETLLIDGEPVVLRRVDDRTLDVVLPSPIAEPALLFDRLYVLPEHRLASGGSSAADAWGAETPVDELAGLGPFRLTQYRPGERLVLERNPHFWKRDEAGNPLPYFDRLAVLVVPDKQAGQIRFEAGEIDLLENISVDAFEQLARKDAFRARDLGAGTAYEFIFFNLNPAPDGADPETVRKRRWFADPRFRRALGLAVDRRGIAEVVYRGRATPIATHVSPGNVRWADPELAAPETSLDAAAALLEEAGFTRGDDRRWRDGDGEPVRLSLVTNATSARRVQTATVVQEDLNRLGLDVRVVSLDFGALLQRVTDSFDYDLVLLGLGGGIDPSSDLNVWHSSGSNHLWHLGTECPTEAWEIRMDELLEEIRTEPDAETRRRLYHEVQGLVVEHQPVIPLVAPNALVAARPELGNFAPTIFEPTVLWNVERLFRRPAGR